jgi:S-DNA-T family DNA segregation ATPase FtsK/SpoIIIE
VSVIEAPTPGRDGRIARELGALSLLALAAFTLLSLISLQLNYRPNFGGKLGALLAGVLQSSLGYQAYLVVLLLALAGQQIWSRRSPRDFARVILGGVIILLALCTGASFLNPGHAAGGYLGWAIARRLFTYLNLGGGWLLVLLAVLGGLALMLRRAPTDLVSALGQITARKKATDSKIEGSAACNSDEAPLIAGTNASAMADGNIEAAREPLLVKRSEPPKPIPRERASNSQPRTQGAYKLPPASLLDTPPLEHAHIDEAALERSARMLEQKLADFGVQGHVVEVQPGPVVTMYKLEPGSGIKVSQIVNLADDLSMALRAATVRILAPVPGEAVVGIEVPNRKREKIYLREILEAEAFGAAQSQLTIALGKDITGQPVAADLASMPHLLIAGATGTGKSVSIHTMIASILFNATADDVRFILIDPKMLELSVYEGIPHLLVPVVIDPGKAAAALLWATQEMEARYRMMRDLGVRNIDGYNRALNANGGLVELKADSRVAQNDGEAPDPATAPIKHHKLPKIVIIIDELADLLLSEGKTVERDITRLAQKARASGIHLILATQRPSVDVLTGLIKANLPARISLQVTSRVDSRTILDSIGAERLLGAGDMLFMPPGTAKLRRLHGPFVSEAEIRRVCDFLRKQGAPDYQMEILETTAAGDGENGGPDGDRDELYDEALRIVLESGQASISMIQRRLRIGYNRAARMVEMMEREGVVLPAEGARPREVRLRGA